MAQSIESRSVSYTYQTAAGPVLAVKDVSFSIAPEEFLCVLGPSGCGKTTILNMLAGFLTPTRGDILMDGRPLAAQEHNRGVVFQDFAQLFPWRTARRNVEFGLEMRGVPAAERRETALRFVRLVKLEKFVDAYPHQLSGGMPSLALPQRSADVIYGIRAEAAHEARGGCNAAPAMRHHMSVGHLSGRGTRGANP
jgi:NitT/TauT family transport system ATP-binding protein